MMKEDHSLRITHRRQTNGQSNFNRQAMCVFALATLIFGGMSLGIAEFTWAQAPMNINIQQPVVRQFGVQTAVLVPDGGTISLGGINRSAVGSIQVGVPGLGNIPFLGRGFRGGAIGWNQSVHQSSLSVQVISMKELEQQILQQASLRQVQRREIDFNGGPEVKKKADFIQKNLGGR